MGEDGAVRFMILFHFIMLLMGIVLIYFSADFLVDSAIQLARRLNIRPFVIGLTVVSFVSSLPELGISLFSVYRNQPEIMFGNIVGSNIANIALIIGISAIIHPLLVQKTVVRRDLYIMLFATAAFIGFLFDLTIERSNGVILFMGIILFNYILIQASNKKRNNGTSNLKETQYLVKNAMGQKYTFLKLILGSGGLIFGSHILVKAAADLAQDFAISKMVISLSIVAIGTALPELGMAIVSSLRKQTDFLVGNIIGSNIYNLFFVIGFTGIAHPSNLIGEKVLFQILALGIFSIILTLFLRSNFDVTRREGIFLIFLYFVYIISIYIF